MSRPSRMATANLKKYTEMNESDSDVVSLSGGDSDDSFDEDEDPDKIEVPGGGSTLENACNRTSPPSSSSGGGGQSTYNPSSNHIKIKVRDPPPLLPSRTTPVHSGSSQLPKFNLPEGTTIRPSQHGNNSGLPVMNPLFDSSLFLANPFNSMPLDSLNGLSALLKMFPSLPTDNFDPGTMNTLSQQLLRFHGLMAGAGNAAAGLQRGPIPGGMQPPRNNVQPQHLWNNANAFPMKQQLLQQAKVEIEEELLHEEDEALGVAETYADYVPAKLKIGKAHPDPIVETASLSSVQPPEVYYKLKLPSKIIDKGLLSALQLESVVYACQQHEFYLRSGERAGYLVGDGAGVGKGRTIAGIIYENWLCGRRKALWVSVSADLKEDSIRDLKDIGAGHIPVMALNKLKYGKISRNDYKDGVLFSTYSGLIGESSTGGKFNARIKQIIEWLGTDFDGVIVFDECHRAKNLCPVGNTKPTKTGVTVQKLQADLPNSRVVYASATGASEPKNMAYMTRLGIWGPGTPFNKFADFINAVEKRGIGAMEIVAMDMKLRGAYIARQLSFKGVTFNIEEVSLNTEFIKMYDESVDMWVEAMQKFIEAAELMKADNAVKKTMWAQFWASHQRFFKYLCIAGKVNRAIDIARDAVKDGKCVVIGLQSTGEARTAEQIEKEGELDDFVSTAKGVFQNLVEKHLPAPDRSKIRRLLGISLLDELKEEPQAGSSSGKGKPMRKAAQNAAKRSRWGNESDGSSNDDKDSDFSAVGSATDSEISTDPQASDSEFESVSSDLESDDEGQGKGRKRKSKKKKKTPKSATVPRDVPSKQALDRAFEIRKELLEKIEKLGEKMPTNTLDHLIDELGGPTDVAEMTGRKMRLIQMESGKIEYQSRAESDVALDHINLTEKQRFMDGEKNIAIISEAASSGISLQSDRRALNKRRRVHITLELPWSADRAIQQFGRTHRSNQVNAPEYVFLISDLAGEHRFASIVAKRLESLGALTHGDRRATETRDLSRFHIDNKYGKMALEAVMKYIMNGSTINMPASPPTGFDGDFRSEVAEGLVGVGLIVNEDKFITPDKDYNNMSKFLNRILGMHVKLQNSLFKFFTDTLSAIIANAKKQGRFDMGILNLGDSTADKTNLTSTERFIRKHATGSGMIEVHQVVVERGMSWDEATAKAKELKGTNDGFYLQHEEKNGKRLAVLVIGDDFAGTSTAKAEKVRYYTVYRPSTGMQLRRETIAEILNKYKKSTPEKVVKSWQDQYKDSGENCVHAFWSGKCKNRDAGFVCDIGKRQRSYYILSGSVLLCWNDVESSMAGSQGHHKIQIVRVQFVDGMKFVGILIPGDCVESLKAKLKKKEELERVQEEDRKANVEEEVQDWDEVDTEAQ